jgi:hypothetical protein
MRHEMAIQFNVGILDFFINHLALSRSSNL